jgi:hypothetical protein
MRVSALMVLFAVSFLTLSNCAAERPNSKPTDVSSRLMFSKPLSDGSMLRIYIKQFPKSDFRSVVPVATLHDLDALSATYAEICPADNTSPIVIFSNIDECYRGWDGIDEPQVLDAACGNGQFVFVLWTYGQLWVYYHDFNDLPQSGVVMIYPAWTIFPVPTPFNAKVTKAVLTLTASNEWKLHVVERDNEAGRVTDYIKPTDKWQFDLVSTVKDGDK